MKHRRLSLRQAIVCELALPLATRCRCRCGGTKRGARRCDPVKPTRWCFSRLDPSDPHYIPAQRRRISPRNAVKSLTKQIHRMERRREFAAAETLRKSRHLANLVVRDERKAREAAGIESNRRNRFPLDPARVLQSAFEWLNEKKGDQSALVLLLNQKLEVLR